MRRGWLIAAICSLALLVPAEYSVGQETGDGKVVTKKIAVPPAKGDRPDSSRSLDELAAALESDQLEIPEGASVTELLKYIRDLSELSRDLASDHRNVQASITRAQGKAAESLLEHSDSISDQDYYLAARLGLSARISQIPYATPQEQQKTYALVVRQLEIGARQGLKMDEIRNVTRTADFLERHGDRVFALDACSRFADILRAANSPRYQETLALLEDTLRRIELVGQTFELSGSTVAGTPFHWSDYRNQVVLVNFWAAWSVPSIAEIRQLKRHYEAYRDQGFEIIGVSLDRDRTELETVIAKEQIPWTNLFQDGIGADHPMAVKYGIREIPSALLIDQQGKVVSTKARGGELDRLLLRMFGAESVIASELVAESRWPEAVSELQRLVAANPSNIDYRLGLGAVQLLGDDPLGYAGTCQASWSAIAQQDSSRMARAIPLYCLPAEHSLNRNQVYETALAIRKADASSNQARLAVVLSAFRAGHDDICLKEEIVDADAFTMAIAAMTQAMAADHLGKDERVAARLIEARGLVEFELSDYLAPATAELPYERWVCCAVAKLMLSEAEAALAVDRSSGDPTRGDSP